MRSLRCYPLRAHDLRARVTLALACLWFCGGKLRGHRNFSFWSYRPFRLYGSAAAARLAPNICLHSLGENDLQTTGQRWTPWAVEGSKGDNHIPGLEEWFGGIVLRTRLGTPELGQRLSKLCLELESRGGGRKVSNAGGFQSKDLTWNPDPALKELSSILHKPLEAFLRGRYKGLPPHSLDATSGLCISAVAADLWANVNRAGARNTIHNHGEPTSSVVASGVYYPSQDGVTDAADGGAKLKLFLPEPEGTLELAPEPGTVVLFPTNLLHETEAVQAGSGVRTSLAFNLRVRWLETPLLRAATAGDAELMRKLVEEGASIEEGDKVLDLRPLHLAAEAGHVSAVRTLLELGANASVISREGSSPLGLAFDCGHRSVEEILGGPKSNDRDRKALAEAGLPPIRPASPNFPGVPLDRPDIVASFQSAGLRPPTTSKAESELGTVVLVGVAAIAIAIVGVFAVLR